MGYYPPRQETPRSDRDPYKLEECPCARHAVCPPGKVPGLFGPRVRPQPLPIP